MTGEFQVEVSFTVRESMTVTVEAQNMEDAEEQAYILVGGPDQFEVDSIKEV